MRADAHARARGAAATRRRTCGCSTTTSTTATPASARTNAWREAHGARPTVILSADASADVRAAVQEAGLPLLMKPLKPLALKSRAGPIAGRARGDLVELASSGSLSSSSRSTTPACVRLRTPSRSKIAVRCALTVRSWMPRRSAICLLSRPSATSTSTRNCCGDRLARRAASAASCARGRRAVDTAPRRPAGSHCSQREHACGSRRAVRPGRCSWAGNRRRRGRARAGSTRGSSFAETTTTATPGCCARIAARPARPWLPGMCRSSSTRSMSGSASSAREHAVERIGFAHLRGRRRHPRPRRARRRGTADGRRRSAAWACGRVSLHRPAAVHLDRVPGDVARRRRDQERGDAGQFVEADEHALRHRLEHDFADDLRLRECRACAPGRRSACRPAASSRRSGRWC